MVAASSANAASGTPFGGGLAAPSVSSALPARNDGRSSSDESEEGEVEWPPGSKESSSGMPVVVVEIPPGEPSDVTVRVVGVPATENQNDGRTFLQDGVGGLEALVQMESLGATELAVLYDFFDDSDIIGYFILTPRETPLTAAELSSQLKNFAVKGGLASILSQFDSKQLALRTPAAQARPAIPVQLLDREGGGSPQGEKRCRGADAFGLRPAHRGARKGHLESPQPSPDAQGGFGDDTSVPEGTCFSIAWSTSPDGTLDKLPSRARDRIMNWPRLRDLLDHLESGSQDPPEWQTVITVMANDNLAFQAPPFVRMVPLQDEGDEETKESNPRLQTPIWIYPGALPGPSSDPSRPNWASDIPAPNLRNLTRSKLRMASKNFQVNGSVRRHPVVRRRYPAAFSCSSSGMSGGLSSRLEGPSSGHPDDGVDDEDKIPDDGSDDGVLNVAQRTTKRRRLSQSSAGVSAPKKIKTKSPTNTKVKVWSSGKSKSWSGSSKKPKPKSGGSRRRTSSTATVLAVKGLQHLDAEECRVIEPPGLGITSWMYFGVRMKPGDSTAHAPFQTQGFPDFVPNRHDLDILKERCDGEELKAFLATRPGTKLSDTRRTEFFFHRRADLGHEVVRALEAWVDFMEENVEALWHATHWVVLDRDSTSKFIRKTSVRRFRRASGRR
ncbi:unnamed protein product [Phytophthora fragariaefolia]|uniref:Unnamed protein product n=1 Tax=Phytophthora fragariaefolia TaxID=1490495 RepID=A0A9W6UBC7_9STRA|nr:unnamed protein product [Phytophthora fragariaefolia]